MRRALLIIALLAVAVVAAAGGEVAQAAAPKPPGYCDMPGHPASVGPLCDFEQQCDKAPIGRQLPTADNKRKEKECADERARRWREICHEAKKLPDDPAWTGYCQERALAQFPPKAWPPPGVGPEQPPATPPPATPPAATPPPATAPPATPPPATPPPATPPQTSQQPAGLTPSSPTCKEINTGNCARAGGSLSRPYPLTRYQLDDHSSSEWDEPGTWFPSMIQSTVAALWFMIMLVVDGALALLEWAFQIRLFGSDQAWIQPDALEHNLLSIHNVLGESWVRLGILLAGIWGVYNGLVRLRAIQTLGGLLATVMLMISALVVIHYPDQTIGQVSRVAHDSSLQALTIASGGSISDPRAAEADAFSGLFNGIVRGPWCSLQFGDPSVCSEKKDWLDGKTIADGYLEHDIEYDDEGEPDGTRADFFDELKDDAPAAAAMQERDGALERLGQLVLILVGVVGALCLLVFIGVKLVMAAVKTLVLIFLCPVMLIVPALGETGRAVFLGYGKQTVSAVIEKFIYAIFLGVVVLVSDLLSDMKGVGAGERWILLSVFWWGTFMRRDELVGMLLLEGAGRGGGGGRRGHGLGMFPAMQNMRALGWMGGNLMRAATAGPKAVIRGGGALSRGVEKSNREHNAANSQDHLRAHMGEAHDVRSRQAQGKLAERDGKRESLNNANASLRDNARERERLKRQQQNNLAERARNQSQREQHQGILHAERTKPLDKADRTAIRGAEDGLRALKNRDKDLWAEQARNEADINDLDRQDRALTAGRDDLMEQLRDPEYRDAEQFMSKHGDGPLSLSEREFGQMIDSRRGELELGAADDRNLISAGIAPDRYHSAPPAMQERMRRVSQDAIDRDRTLINNLHDTDGRTYSASYLDEKGRGTRARAREREMQQRDRHRGRHR